LLVHGITIDPKAATSFPASSLQQQATDKMAQRLAVLLVLASIAVAVADMPAAEVAKYKEHEKEHKVSCGQWNNPVLAVFSMTHAHCGYFYRFIFQSLSLHVHDCIGVLQCWFASASVCKSVRCELFTGHRFGAC
jgi:hypothetical protein